MVHQTETVNCWERSGFTQADDQTWCNRAATVPPECVFWWPSERCEACLAWSLCVEYGCWVAKSRVVWVFQSWNAEIDVLSPVPHQKKIVVGSFEGFQQVTAKGCDLQGIAQCNFWQRRSKASTALADVLDQLQCVISWIHYIVENGTMDDNGWQVLFNGKKKHVESAAVDFPIKTSYRYVICRCLEST